MSAMQAMVQKMLGDMLQNLPPEIQEKIDVIGSFTGRLDGRLNAIENDLQAIKSHLGISTVKAITNGHRTGNQDVAGTSHEA
jgi:hypothetical protein